MSIRRTIVAGVLVLGVAGIAHAQKKAEPKGEAKEIKVKEPAPTGMQMPEAKPDPALDQYKDMVGTWRCTGVMHMGGQDIPSKGTAKFKWDLDKFWIVGTFSSPKSKTMPAYKGTAYYGYDTKAKTYVMYSFDNMGGWGRATSKGWVNDVQEWSGTANMMGQDMKIKSTITRKGAREVSIADTMGAGAMTMTSEMTCKK